MHTVNHSNVTKPRVLINGVPMDADQLGALQRHAAAIQDADLNDRISGESDILSLCEMDNESAFLERHLALYGGRTQVDMSRMQWPPAKGVVRRFLRVVRGGLWTLGRSPHYWQAFQQNAINEQAATALALEVKLRQAECDVLRQRIETLEDRLTAFASNNHMSANGRGLDDA